MKEEKIVIPNGLENRLENLIDCLDRREKQTKRRKIRIWTGCAAGLALLISLCLYFNTQQKHNLQFTTHRIENPETAYIEAQQALKKVSLKFNKGANQLAMATKEIDKTNKILNKTLKKEKK